MFLCETVQTSTDVQTQYLSVNDSDMNPLEEFTNLRMRVRKVQKIFDNLNGYLGNALGTDAFFNETEGGAKVGLQLFI